MKETIGHLHSLNILCLPKAFQRGQHMIQYLASCLLSLQTSTVRPRKNFFLCLPT